MKQVITKLLRKPSRLLLPITLLLLATTLFSAPVLGKTQQPHNVLATSVQHHNTTGQEHGKDNNQTDDHDRTCTPGGNATGTTTFTATQLVNVLNITIGGITITNGTSTLTFLTGTLIGTAPANVSIITNPSLQQQAAIVSAKFTGKLNGMTVTKLPLVFVFPPSAISATILNGQVLIFNPATAQATNGTVQFNTATGQGTITLPSSSTGTGQSTSTVLSNNPNSPDWTVFAPSWTLSNNGYLDGSGLSPIIVSTASFPADRVVDVDFKTVTAGSDQPWYVAWVTPKWVDYFDKIVFDLYTSGTVEISIHYGNNPTSHYFNTTHLSPLAIHHAKITISGNTIKAYVDGVLYITANDPLVGALGASKVSLASWGPSESQFNKMTVTTAGTSPATGNCNENEDECTGTGGTGGTGLTRTSTTGQLTNIHNSTENGISTITGSSTASFNTGPLRGTASVMVTLAINAALQANFNNRHRHIHWNNQWRISK